MFRDPSDFKELYQNPSRIETHRPNRTNKKNNFMTRNLKLKRTVDKVKTEFIQNSRTNLLNKLKIIYH